MYEVPLSWLLFLLCQVCARPPVPSQGYFAVVLEAFESVAILPAPSWLRG